MIKSALLTFALVFSTVIASANTCVDVFKAPNETFLELAEDKIELAGIKILRDDSPQQIKSKKDLGYRESLKNLLMMLTETQFENISKKDMLKKGELRLGKVFDDGLSLEFVYEGDIRSNENFFFLKKIKLIKPNGLSKDLDGSPVPDIGRPATSRTILVKKEKVSDETSEVKIVDEETVLDLMSDETVKPAKLQTKLDVLKQRVQEVKVPHKIEGVLLDDLKRWSGYVRHVERPKMRARIESDQIKRLLFEAGTVRSVRWMGRVLNKMLFKETIRTAVIVALAYNVFAPSSVDKAPVQTAVHAPAHSKQVDLSKRDLQIIELIADLTAKESQKQGSALFYTGSQRDAGMVLTAQSKDSNLMISVFPKLEKIIVIAETKENTESSPIIITKKDNAKAYDFIANQMEGLYASHP